MNFPIISALILLPTIGSLFLIFSKSNDQNNSTIKYVALFTSIVNFLLSIYLWYLFDPTTSAFQFVEDREWLIGIVNYKVGVDGISILFVVLTAFITPLCIISVNNSVKKRLRDFLIAILIMESFMIGVFCSLDLVIFYLFFEAGLIPMFLIIGIWGGPKRVYSAFKFFLYTLLGSVLMLVAIISIYWIAGTTDVEKLYQLGIDPKYQNLLWLAFFSSFAVKTPMWPVHTWLPDAHVEAPTAGSVLLAAILLKMAGYGFIRFSLGLFPIASDLFTPLIYVLSLIAIIFTSLIALMQEDMKKLIAYSSVAHMGFVTLGIFTIQQQGIEGSIIQMISHGLVSAALFLCVGVVYDRMHSRLISTYGGIVSIVPKYSVLFMLFTLAALGLPGTSGFIGEFLILMGAFKDNFLVAFVASLGVILGAAYMLWLYKRVVFGKLVNDDLNKLSDLDKSEYFILISLAIPTLFFGFYPEPLFNTIEVSINDLIEMYNSNLINK
ncbi:NADH-quinone oxidoreductase subunit M [Candidatus Pelagibacter sp. HIMB1321]|jgi:NADH-quinone oxidoreductase subunit M|uniref:NADH-quinone oxidoreductase subunit M n=1 Tax=Candidatus Pelagibacter sp. HIMB1321 TaxID=1388755 RepID=UPI000A0803A6|nr:NADH-quinone oxidoreductase subunit M [Candidatus Pelagibacter sp. HIMB1321]SMF74552.1 NADH dehydrogenase subunit M [Candidatus Pelagibacter sp. HIMB1321]